MVDVDTTIKTCALVSIASFILCGLFAVLSFTYFVGFLGYSVVWAVIGLVNMGIAGAYKRKAQQKVKTSYK